MAIEEYLVTLPDEILGLICSELGAERDFASLYNCALSSKSLADPALKTLYRRLSHHWGTSQKCTISRKSNLSPVSWKGVSTIYPARTLIFAVANQISKSDRPETFAAKAAESDALLRRWARVWRSIILSTEEGKTFKPYCLYIRILDFRNLSSLLEDPKFANNIRKEFFANGLGKFHFKLSMADAPTRKFQYLDATATINAVGEVITPKSLLLEEIDGHLSQGYLPRWIRNSSRLRSMTLFDGDALTNDAGIAIRESCPEFRSLTIRAWSVPNADQTFADFLNSINDNTLEDFTMISSNRLGGLSFSALGRHAASLRELKLNNLTKDAVENLDELRECTSIRLLALEDNTRGATRLETDRIGVFNGVVSWLSACTELRDISLANFHDGPAILAQVLSAPAVKIERLSLEGYNLSIASNFHVSLTEQQQLQCVWLKGTADEDSNPTHLTIMVDSLCHLPHLRELYLKDISDDFEEFHITRLALSLPLLEDFWTSGEALGPDILPVLAGMKYLKNLNMYAITQFTSSDILSFISELDDNMHKGFNFMLMASDTAYDLTEQEQDLIREVLKEKLDGRFDFVCWREPDNDLDSDDD